MTPYQTLHLTLLAHMARGIGLQLNLASLVQARASTDLMVKEAEKTEAWHAVLDRIIEEIQAAGSEGQ